MVPHPNTIITSADMHQQELLATAERERRVKNCTMPVLPWRTLAVRVAAVVALFLGVRG